MPQVVVLGDVAIDIVAQLESYPPLGGDVQPLDTTLRVGGTSLNTAMMLTRLGIETALVARVGRDVLGDFALAEMERNSLSTRWMQRDAQALTGIVYVAVTPDGQRTLLGGAGANRNLSARALPRDVIRQARWLHITSYNVLAAPSLAATSQAVQMAREHAAITSLDIGLAPLRLAPDALQVIAEQVDVLLPSADTPIARRSGQWVVRKLGAAGCEIEGGDGQLVARVPAFAIHAVDTTGAGDAFDAGLIAGRVRGLDWRESALLANACGAAACTVLGAGGAFPSREFIADLLRHHAPDEWRREAERILSNLQSPIFNLYQRVHD